jgi:hypothetical protein
MCANVVSSLSLESVVRSRAGWTIHSVHTQCTHSTEVPANKMLSGTFGLCQELSRTLFAAIMAMGHEIGCVPVALQLSKRLAARQAIRRQQEAEEAAAAALRQKAAQEWEKVQKRFGMVSVLFAPFRTIRASNSRISQLQTTGGT